MSSCRGRFRCRPLFTGLAITAASVRPIISFLRNIGRQSPSTPPYLTSSGAPGVETLLTQYSILSRATSSPDIKSPLSQPRILCVRSFLQSLSRRRMLPFSCCVQLPRGSFSFQRARELQQRWRNSCGLEASCRSLLLQRWRDRAECMLSDQKEANLPCGRCARCVSLEALVGRSVDYIKTKNTSQMRNSVVEDKSCASHFLCANWTRLLAAAQKLGKWSGGNRVELFEKNNDAFASMWNAIDNARSHVWMETYIFDNSEVAKATARRLASAAARGCDVILLADYIGSYSLKNKCIRDLLDAGVKVVFFNPPFPAEKNIGPLAFRDHRKILIADDVGFLGSINTSDDDADPPYGNGKYYNVHVRLYGPSVSDLASVFLDSLREARSDMRRSIPPTSPPFPDGVYVQILESNVRRKIRSIQRVLEHSIRQASLSLYITQSYFITPGFLKKALRAACRRGVAVSALLSGASDVPGDVAATMYLIPQFLSQNEKDGKTRVFFMQSRHNHAKYTVIDHVWSCIGSFNWDRYSTRRNLEVVAAIFDPKIAAQLEKMHQTKALDASVSQEIHRDNWKSLSSYRKAICFMAYYIAKFTGHPVFDGFESDTASQLSRHPFVESLYCPSSSSPAPNPPPAKSW